MVEHIVQPVHAAEHLQGAQLVHSKLKVCICIEHQLVHTSCAGSAGADVEGHLPACRSVWGRQSELAGVASVTGLLARVKG